MFFDGYDCMETTFKLRENEKSVGVALKSVYIQLYHVKQICIQTLLALFNSDRTNLCLLHEKVNH